MDSSYTDCFKMFILLASYDIGKMVVYSYNRDGWLCFHIVANEMSSSSKVL